MMRNLFLLAVTLTLVVRGAGKSLTVEDARTLIENTPEFLKASEAKRCPRTELLWSNESNAAFQARSHCHTSAGGLIGNYTVDLKTAEVWRGTDRNERIESAHLRQMQERLRQKMKRMAKPTEPKSKTKKDGKR
jgi:hypothetical protein